MKKKPRLLLPVKNLWQQLFPPLHHRFHTTHNSAEVEGLEPIRDLPLKLLYRATGKDRHLVGAQQLKVILQKHGYWKNVGKIIFYCPPRPDSIMSGKVEYWCDDLKAYWRDRKKKSKPSPVQTKQAEELFVPAEIDW